MLGPLHAESLTPGSFCVSLGAGEWVLTVSLLALGGPGCLSAALAGFHHHVGELLHFGGPPDVVQDGEWLQVLGDTAGRGRRLRVQRVV